MSKIALKKYVEEQLQFDLESYLDDIVHDFAFNTQDKLIVSSDVTAKQLITVKKDLLELKVKTIITVLGVAASKDFVERILNNLPSYERKDSLIVELAKAISRELQKIELLKSEYISSLSITTATAISLKRLEKIYGINTNYELGVKLRQNILIAREITKYSTFNFAYILKMCELFILGNVIDVINDKKKKSVTIILEDNINNITSLPDFLEHIKEFSPAFYEITVKNNS
ncbi:hypothetical protein I6E17_08900 [Fusobacterium perfoetens]|uniref:hypothetical protein n=1 Tax=Fusobacterium perfoetens TaxID=852 RepID=UPI001F205D35|nr:hypothetical protein [Fusobacterium perfoetens]MCF2626269.1 hypothetical protein [Fusobacterium perfoetens]